MALISVIVPVYKVEPYLHRCVDSILTQSFKDFELILVDDGSPDNCPMICDEYGKKDNRVVVIHKNNGGLSSARNAGLDYSFAYSNSKYVIFIDSDDWIEDNMLYEMYSSIARNNVDIVVCNYYVFNGKIEKENHSKVVINPIIESCDILKYIEFSLRNVVWNKLYKKDLFNELRFINGHIYEDTSIVLKLYSKTKYVFLLNQCLYHYLKRPDSITSSYSEEDSIIATIEQTKDLISWDVDYFTSIDSFFVTVLMVGKNRTYIIKYKKTLNNLRKLLSNNVKSLPRKKKIGLLLTRFPRLFCFLMDYK